MRGEATFLANHGTKKPPFRKRRSPAAAAKKQLKHPQEGSGSRQSYRVHSCRFLENTAAKRARPCGK